MKVFLSWSGSPSREIAECFYEWIPRVIQAVDPYLSSQDIEKGERWLSSVTSSLDDINFGIVFVTPANLVAPWINFEAGSLSKKIDRGKLVPVLFNVTDSDLVNHPLSQFQYAKLEKDDLTRLFRVINLSTASPMPDSQFSETFEIWYPRFQARLAQIADELPAKEEKKEKISTDQRVQKLELAIDEILNSQRKQARTLDRIFREVRPRTAFRHDSLGSEDVVNALIGKPSSQFDQKIAEILEAVRTKQLQDDGLENPEE